MEKPSAPAQSPNETQENYKFICHGCNILLRQTTSRFQKWEYEGPGRCIGCEFSTEDGYVRILYTRRKNMGKSIANI
ncbi:hypothetical protein N7501_003108 [Penicillium viridicatum]|nr:hypothetical protein N7501_003108 [Penicillium viridicatum]